MTFISRQYKPLYKELPSWPELNLFNPPGVSLFADSKQAKARQVLKSSSALRNDHKERSVLLVFNFPTFLGEVSLCSSYLLVGIALMSFKKYTLTPHHLQVFCFLKMAQCAKLQSGTTV